MTRHEHQILSRVLTDIWRTRLALALDDPNAPHADLDQALRHLTLLLPGGQDDLATLATAAGSAGQRLYHRILRTEDHHEPARQLRLALDDAW